ncbi:MAG TPA: hypothetical protein VL985_17430, partial [Stellaceae bacterium]|nr:hypothetical protein [Stellaceae bacterium]
SISRAILRIAAAIGGFPIFKSIKQAARSYSSAQPVNRHRCRRWRLQLTMELWSYYNNLT